MSPAKKIKKECSDCGFVGDSSQFVLGRKVCKACQRKRMAVSRGKKAPKKLEIQKPAVSKSRKKKAGLEAFSTREGLSDMLKDNLSRALEDANEQVAYNKLRLAAATKLEDSELIDEANKGLAAAMSQHTQLTTRLMEKLQAMEDLRAQQEKAKPVTFYFVTAPGKPNILPTRDLPEDLKLATAE